MYAHVSREEWLFRGLAIATILALVGMAVMPAVSIGKAGYLIDQWLNSLPNNDKIPPIVKFLASGTGSFVIGNTASILVRLALIYAGYGAAAGPAGAIVGLCVGLL